MPGAQRARQPHRFCASRSPGPSRNPRGPSLAGVLRYLIIRTKTIRIEGRSHVRETIGRLSYVISPAAFFQTNARAAAVLQKCVTEGVCGAERVLDLYCGSGLFSLPLAAAGARVAGIDENL